MIVLNMPQGSQEWIDARLGVATASTFDKILTAKGLKPSAQLEGVACQLVAERLTGEPSDPPLDSYWVRRGQELEPHARALYSMMRDVTVEQVGMVLRDDRRVGCSPDGLVGDPGLLEIKCPAPGTHVGYLAEGQLPERYRAQVQGQLWVSQRQWCDFLSYHPSMPPLLVRVERDEAYIAALSAAVEALVERMDAIEAQLAAAGLTASAQEVEA
ncbi:MAG: lambda exonuclease family protein [Halomonas sp.]